VGSLFAGLVILGGVIMLFLFRRSKQRRSEARDLPSVVTSKTAAIGAGPTTIEEERTTDPPSHRLQYPDYGAEPVAAARDQTAPEISQGLRYPEDPWDPSLARVI